MARYVLLRLVHAVLVLWAAYTLAFILLTALPGNAISNLINNPQNQLTPEDGKILKAFYGLDHPVVVQYVRALDALFHGNLGYSLSNGAKVSDLLGGALPGTLELTALGLLFGVVIAAAVGVVGSYARWNWLRTPLQSFPAVAASVPSFVVGILILYYFSFELHVIPAVDDGTLLASVAPAITLGIMISAPLSQVFSSSIAATRRQPFVHVLQARGAAESYIFGRGILRNSSLPVLTMLGLAVGELIAGSVVTEAVFARNGIGQITLNAVNTQDLPVVQGVVLVATTGYVVVNLLVDVVHPLIDPRIRADILAERAKKAERSEKGTPAREVPSPPLTEEVATR
ncbi:ABC transporter permease [Streptomyces sp. RTd22]|uniref:ABC transporter permease n=1 Tax=Streptomyces sp. RTd22 TaxID=1841249 RepID=UPI0007C56B25|nr:ABC transporter permease [Streptomyces sp. RTd22]